MWTKTVLMTTTKCGGRLMSNLCWNQLPMQSFPLPLSMFAPTRSVWRRVGGLDGSLVSRARGRCALRTVSSLLPHGGFLFLFHNCRNFDYPSSLTGVMQIKGLSALAFQLWLDLVQFYLHLCAFLCGWIYVDRIVIQVIHLW